MNRKNEVKKQKEESAKRMMEYQKACKKMLGLRKHGNTHVRRG